jgi:hypothetical protein
MRHSPKDQQEYLKAEEPQSRFIADTVAAEPDAANTKAPPHMLTSSSARSVPLTLSAVNCPNITRYWP